MDLELHPLTNLGSRAFYILVAPLQILMRALNYHLDLQRFEVIYICGNRSCVLSNLNRRFTSLQVRRAFTIFQLMTVLEESRHTLLTIEHDPMLYEDAEEMVEYVSQAMRTTAKSRTVLLYASASDPFLEVMTNYADGVFCFTRGPDTAARPSAKNCRKAQTDSTDQTTLEAF
jgi:DNA polymerase I